MPPADTGENVRCEPWAWERRGRQKSLCGSVKARQRRDTS